MQIFAVLHLAQLRAINTVTGSNSSPYPDVQIAAAGDRTWCLLARYPHPAILTHKHTHTWHACAAYAGHAVLNLFFPWRSAKIEPLLTTFALTTPEDAFAAEVGYNQGVHVFRST